MTTTTLSHNALPTTITSFVNGTDKIDVADLLTNSNNYNSATDPFTAGYLRLIQVSSDSVQLQWNDQQTSNSYTNGWQTMLVINATGIAAAIDKTDFTNIGYNSDTSVVTAATSFDTTSPYFGGIDTTTNVYQTETESQAALLTPKTGSLTINDPNFASSDIVTVEVSNAVATGTSTNSQALATYFNDTQVGGGGA